MSGGNFVQTRTMFWVLSDRDAYFPRYESRSGQEEYGMSEAQFLDEHENEAFADVQEIWDRADEALRRDLLLACRDRLTQQIQELQEQYTDVERELHRALCVGSGSNGG